MGKVVCIQNKGGPMRIGRQQIEVGDQGGSGCHTELVVEDSCTGMVRKLDR